MSNLGILSLKSLTSSYNQNEQVRIVKDKSPLIISSVYSNELSGKGSRVSPLSHQISFKELEVPMAKDILPRT